MNTFSHVQSTGHLQERPLRFDPKYSKLMAYNIEIICIDTVVQRKTLYLVTITQIDIAFNPLFAGLSEYGIH